MIEDLKIFIIENNRDYRFFLSKVIANIDGAEIIDAVSNGRYALARLKQAPVDLVVLQMETPAMDGVQTLEELRESCPETGVIAISASKFGKSRGCSQRGPDGGTRFYIRFRRRSQ